MAKKDILVHLDLNTNELRNFTCEKVAVDPGSPFEGQIWENTTSKRLKTYLNGTIETIALLSDVTSAVQLIGGYDAATNTPDLDTAPSGLFKGDLFYVTAAGTFFTEPLQIGDQLIAKIDSPTLLTDWIIIQANLQPASETISGYIEIATQVETDLGTDDARAITPLKLATYLANKLFVKSFAVDLADAEASVVRVFAGGETTYTVTHGFNTTDVQVEVYLQSTGARVITDVIAVSATDIEVVFNGNSTDDTYRVVVHSK